MEVSLYNGKERKLNGKDFDFQKMGSVRDICLLPFSSPSEKNLSPHNNSFSEAGEKEVVCFLRTEKDWA